MILDLQTISLKYSILIELYKQKKKIITQTKHFSTVCLIAVSSTAMQLEAPLSPLSLAQSSVAYAANGELEWAGDRVVPDEECCILQKDPNGDP